MQSKLLIEYNQQGYYGLLDGEPITSMQQHVIYTPNASLIRLLYEEICELNKLQLNPENGVVFRMISHAVDAYPPHDRQLPGRDAPRLRHLPLLLALLRRLP